MTELPIVIVPVGADDDALDACLGALEAGTRPGTRVWLADDARIGPRGYAIVERWMAGTALQADYTRRQRAIGEVAHLDEVLAACGDADVAVLAPDAVPTPGWLGRLAGSLRADGAIATATPWCNAGEVAAWPRVGEISPLPDEPLRIARAAAAMPSACPELPAAVGHAVLIRGSARIKAGGLDTTSYGSWYAALIDLSLRLAGLGWRNVLCDTAFVGRAGEGAPFDGDMERLAVRWPDWHPRLAGFLMRDPLRESRERLAALLAEVGPPDPQRDLFWDEDDAAGTDADDGRSARMAPPKAGEGS
ncbi:glycosyltransferase [Lysobacter maris]|uniref:Glycosyltransferase n=1 Tax=Marilutibacter maris TaxID=1605891 RepID=A0A508B0J6_9GAMM|nr:glycosyltransferase [Lysobacter maris]KAB8187479.1 glycosyltransferase [Lysobacter maris]